MLPKSLNNNFGVNHNKPIKLTIIWNYYIFLIRVDKYYGYSKYLFVKSTGYLIEIDIIKINS